MISSRTDPAPSAADGSATLRFLQDALGADPTLSGAIYKQDPVTSAYAISSWFGVETELVDRVRESLVFPVGQEGGLIGCVADTRRAAYDPECEARKCWVLERSSLPVGSAYLVPVLAGDSVPAVVTMVSKSPDDFSDDKRALIDLLADFAGRVIEAEATIRNSVRGIEMNVRGISVDWADILGTLEPKKSDTARDHLRKLSRREWEVVQNLQSGRRTATIARELGISENTVRNHVKSISRKLAVRSQNELRELVGQLRLDP
ncbi:MAG TPA: LuxR C-terminal-related transcriptional regulator [Myxococcota bacterium]|nr:LuxR C-terminal-related transcriptional regulator [Myxococcota bacterium]